MDAGTATQLITVAATLGGVVLTLTANAYLERRRARDVRDLESMRLDSEHARWLRDGRQSAYAALSLAGEEVLQFIRSDLPIMLGPDSDARRGDTKARWHNLRSELRKAYNQVALLGGDDVRTAAQELWRVGRNVGNDLLRDCDAAALDSAQPVDLAVQIETGASRLGTVGERFLEACRVDLQGE